MIIWILRYAAIAKYSKPIQYSILHFTWIWIPEQNVLVFAFTCNTLFQGGKMIISHQGFQKPISLTGQSLSPRDLSTYVSVIGILHCFNYMTEYRLIIQVALCIMLSVYINAVNQNNYGVKRRGYTVLVITGWKVQYTKVQYMCISDLQVGCKVVCICVK